MLTPSRRAGGGSDLTIERTGRAQYRAGYGAVEPGRPAAPVRRLAPDPARRPPLRARGPGDRLGARGAGSRPGPAGRRRARRGQDPAGRRGRRRAARAGRRRAGGHGHEGRRGALPAVRRDAGPPVPGERARHAGRSPGKLRLLSRHAATPPARTRPSRPATAAATCSRPSPSCSGRSPATGRWSSSSTTCTGRSCRPSRCSSTWSTPAWTPRRWWWPPSAPPRRTGRTSSAPGWPTCTGSTACAASTSPGSTPRPSPSSCASTRACRRPRRGPPAAILRDRTGGNPFFLRETWLDLERSGGVAALRGPQRVPVTLGDTVAARLAGLGGAAAGDRRAGRGDRRRVRPADAGPGRHGRPGHEHGRGRRRGRGRPARTGGRYRGPLRVRALADPAGRARPAAAHPLHGAARPGGADAGGPRRPRADAADRAPLPRGARARLPRAGAAARDGGRPAGRAQPGVRGGGAVVRPGRVPAGDAGGASARSCRSRPRRTTCARATSPGPGASTSG